MHKLLCNRPLSATMAAMQKERYRRVGLRDIADATHLSVATVSRVLREKTPERFSTETRELVIKTAEQMRYRPNLLASAARGGSSRTVGVFVPPYDQFWTEVIYGVHDQLLADDHVPLILWPTHIVEPQSQTSESVKTGRNADELSQLHRMIDRAVDGLIVWPLVDPLAIEYLEHLAEGGLPIIGIDHVPVARSEAYTVGTDEAAGAKMVAEHLHGLGHRAVIHLAGPSHLAWSERRTRFFRNAFDALPDAWTVSIPAGVPEQTLRKLKGLLVGRTPVSAIYCSTDELARIAVQAMDEIGLRLGRDLSLVSVGDTGFAQGARITSLRQRPFEIGQLGARLALQARKDPGSIESRDQSLLPELIVRDSTQEAPRG
jgi:DNA-binding LacI/PurR family transcriptional regulator